MESKKKKNIIIGIIIAVVTLVVVVFGTLASLGIFREFDAKGYVSAILDQTLKGEVKAAASMTEGTTEESLYAQYEAGIESFVNYNLIDGEEISDEMEERCMDLCKKVFASMKYEVQEAEKVSNEEYHVTVTYQPSDIFRKFIISIQNEEARLDEKVENGEYRGTEDEINAKMKEEFLNNFCDLFETAYNTMEFGEEKTVVLKVVKGSDGLFKLENAGITEFLTKILGLDEIQD